MTTTKKKTSGRVMWRAVTWRAQVGMAELHINRWIATRDYGWRIIRGSLKIAASGCAPTLAAAKRAALKAARKLARESARCVASVGQGARDDAC